MMFLTIGDKIRDAREKYGLKQIAFESYGFSRNYISMIETKKRSLNENMFKTMYNAICELSNHTYQKEYSYDEFIKSPIEQARDWLELHCNIEDALNQYNTYNQVAINYKQIDYQIKIEKILGNYYTQKGDLLSANNHLLKAIGYCLQYSKNPTLLYESVGKNYILLGQYSEAIAALQLSLNCLGGNKNENIYRIGYCIALSYMSHGKYDKSLEWLNPVLEQNEYLKIKSAGYLIKETILKKSGKTEEGRQVLLEFINNPCHDEYLGFAYHNLGCSFKDSGLYREALEALKAALPLRKPGQEQAITKCLMGEIYFKSGEYEKANKFLIEVKDIIFQQCSRDQKEAALEWGFELYWTIQDFDSILILLNDIHQLVQEEIISPLIYTNFQNRIYKIIMDEILKKKEDLAQYRSLLEAII